ncbi:membrane protein [Nitrospira sp.]|nr:membrane protein [Nitrospira sp.]
MILISLNNLAAFSLIVSVGCALVIAFDIAAGRRQHAWIMNVVWPITALYAGPLALWAYYRLGRLSTHHRMQEATAQGRKPPAKEKPFWQSVGLAATHCGSGCTLGDIVAESILLVLPFTLFGKAIFAAWLVDFVAAFLFGIAFQYFTIMPMRKLSPRDGLVAALKADTLSLTAWQVGMYGWMAIVTFVIMGHQLDKTGPFFWFMMQIAMLAGFLTSYPINWWLLKAGIKERM